MQKGELGGTRWGRSGGPKADNKQGLVGHMREFWFFPKRSGKLLTDLTQRSDMLLCFYTDDFVDCLTNRLGKVSLEPKLSSWFARPSFRWPLSSPITSFRVHSARLQGTQGHSETDFRTVFSYAFALSILPPTLLVKTLSLLKETHLIQSSIPPWKFFIVL